MKKLYIVPMIIYLLIVHVVLVNGQTDPVQDFSSSAIPDSLKTNANAVIRDEVLEYTYLSPVSNLLRYRKAVTVLNRNGDENAAFLQSYDKFRKIIYFKGEILDANGKLIRKINKKNIFFIPGAQKLRQAGRRP